MKEIGISSLLVGTNAGGVKVRDSLLAVLEGVESANAALGERSGPCASRRCSSSSYT